MRFNKKAQSIIEYLLVFAGVTLAILYGVKVMTGKSKSHMDTTAGAIDKADEHIRSVLQ